METPTSKEDLKRPNKAIIKCKKRDNYVEEFVQWYRNMKLPVEVVIDDKRTDIEVDLMLDDELLDQLGCPQE